LLWLPARDGAGLELALTITLDVDSGGWLLEMTTPAFGATGTPVYSRIVLPMAAIEQGATDGYVDALFQMHLRFIGVR
jgi:hypothetical protein